MMDQISYRAFVAPTVRFELTENNEPLWIINGRMCWSLAAARECYRRECER